MAVVVPFSTNRPHFAGHAFVRQGSESVKASREIFNELIASQNDKAQRILSEKGKSISVKFKDNRPLPTPDAYLIHRDDRDYRITRCDAHVVEFKDVNMGYIYAESLEHVAIGYDAGRQRFQLIIEGLRQTGQPLRVTHPFSPSRFVWQKNDERGFVPPPLTGRTVSRSRGGHRQIQQQEPSFVVANAVGRVSGEVISLV